MAYQYSRIWEEKPLTDQIRACLLESPSELIITSATSNVMREPGCIVLLDHKYPIVGLVDVSIDRSRTTSANTARISFENIQGRYTGPNKQKVVSDTPVSIYMGYSKNYLQRFEGYVDTLEVTTDGSRSLISLSCRDKAKDFLEMELSAGIYAPDSDYFGYENWHYDMGTDRFGQPVKLPRPWLISEVFRDVCYCMELRDVVDVVLVSEVEDPVTGLLSYSRKVDFRPQYRIEIDPTVDRFIKCNFVEENALDILAQIAQSIVHECLFEADGTLVIRPIKTAKDPVAFYYKEERDIMSFRDSVNNDDITNAITIVGQTQNEVCVTYPFGAVAVAEDVTLDKGQDKYGWSMQYPKVVGPENIATLKHGSLYAHVIAPNAGPVSEPKYNPENTPQFDVRVHYPNFSQPYDKQECLSATCPIITDEATLANTNNMRTWNYYGSLDAAVTYERMPIMLVDRFNKPVLVVCKERSMDDTKIKACGNDPYDPGLATSTTDADPDAVINIPTVIDGMKFTVSGSGIYTSTDLPSVPTSSATPVYGGVPVPGLDAQYLMGYENLTGETVSSDAVAFMPVGMTQAMTSNKMVRIVQANVYKGLSKYKPAVPDFLYDQYASSTVMNDVTMFRATKTVMVMQYLYADGVTTGMHVADYLDPLVFDSCASTTFTLDPNPLYSNCSLAPILGVPTAKTLAAQDASGAILTKPPAGSTVVPATATPLIIKYPLVFYAPSSGMTSLAVTWTTSLVTDEMLSIFQSIKDSSGKSMTVYATAIDPTYIATGGPDVNSIYWMWYGDFRKNPTPSKRGANTQTGNQGRDAYGNERVLIKKDDFYKLAADPNTVVLEITTAGVDHASWAEVIRFDEYRLVVKGHNLYGSMADEWKKLMDSIKEMLLKLIICLTVIALAFFLIFHVGMGYTVTSVAQGAAATGVTAFDVFLLTIFFAALAYLLLDDHNLGANVSKVMEDLSGKVTAKRREEIHLFQNSIQAAQWYIQEEGNKFTGQTMQHMVFSYNETTSLATVYTPNYQAKADPATASLRGRSWVFIMDVTKQGLSGADFSQGCWLTSIGWETPEIGDRNPIDYYYTLSNGAASAYPRPGVTGSRTEIATRFAIEAFGDDENDPMYTAETLLGLRFENNPTIGITPGPAETWYNSPAYEVLVDRSMTEQSVSDTGFWFDFFEKRENYADRRYRYVALVIFEWTIRKYDADGNLLSATPYVAGGMPADPKTIFAQNDPPASLASLGNGPARWGLVVPRGLNPQWYGRFRWMEKDPKTGINKLEQNYTHVDVLSIGQEKLIAHLLNNFRYSVITIDFRVWGKAFGKYAPTLVYYQNVDILSVGTHGYRELKLSNNLINDTSTARKMASLLAAQSNQTYSMETTGKPYIFEGDVVMVKEETSGALAGNFRTWEMNWFDPEERECVIPSNKLLPLKLTGMYAPQCALATFGNNTLIGCSDGTRPVYLIEVDKASNPIWYAKTTVNDQPMFLLRWTGLSHKYLGSGQVFTYVGLRSGIIYKLDYAVAGVVDTFTMPASINCGCMDEEQAHMWVGLTTGLVALNVIAGGTNVYEPIGDVKGVSNVAFQIYDKLTMEYRYQDYGVVFIVGTGGIKAYKNFSDNSRTALGPLLASYTGSLPFDNPGSLWYDKSLNELLYVNKSSPSRPASIHGIRVEIDFDPAYPDAGFVVEFVDVAWELDYMNDAELTATIPVTADRKAYIDSFFQPIQASRDVNRDVLYVDALSRKEGRVSRISPNGKFYVTKIGDSFNWSNQGVSYKQSLEMVTIAAAGSLQLTNFGKNFINTNTQQIIDANASTSMARIISALPKGKYLVKLLTSDTIAEAINNTNDVLNTHETVLVMFGYNGDTSGVATIIGKVALNDWSLEAGEPYVYVDATNIDVTKYGELVTAQGNSSADLSTVTALIRKLESNVRMLGGLHGLRL